MGERDEWKSAEEKGTEREHQTGGGKCHNDAHVNARLWDVHMEPVEAAAIMSTGHKDECFEEDQRSEYIR